MDLDIAPHVEWLAAIDEGMTKARDRNNAFIVRRLMNSRGWLHQEFGDFRGAVETAM